MSSTPRPRPIVVVDDHAAVRGALGNLLRSCGYDVALFASAEELLTQACLPDTPCMLIDVCLSGMNGFDLQRELISRGHRVPTIFISAEADPTLSARAASAGALAFLPKPISEGSLLGSLNLALGSAHAGAT